MTNKLPFPLPPLSFFTNLVEIALNRALETDTLTRNKLAELDGKTVALHFMSPDIRLHIFPNQQGLDILIAGEENIDIDATIETMPLTLVRTFFERNFDWPDSSDWSLSGDVEIAQHLIDTLLSLQIDWEELVAQRVGDVPARFIGRFVERGTNSGNPIRHRLRDFLQAELQLLPSVQEIDEFVENVTDLTQRVDELSARIERLRNTQ